MPDCPGVRAKGNMLATHLKRNVGCTTADRRVVVMGWADQLEIESEEDGPRSSDGSQRKCPATTRLRQPGHADADQRDERCEKALRERPSSIPKRHARVREEDSEPHKRSDDEEPPIGVHRPA